MGRRKALPPDFDGNYTEDMLSERQRNILKFVRTFINHKGYPPAVREIGAAVGLSSSASVHNHLKKLQEYGFIQRDAAKPRALELMSESDAWRNKLLVPVPLVGKVTAGVPILAVENIEETYPIPRDLIGCDDDVFMLSVCGDSMINAGILDHDYIIARKQNFANNGDIVVALIDFTHNSLHLSIHHLDIASRLACLLCDFRLGQIRINICVRIKLASSGLCSRRLVG